MSLSVSARGSWSILAAALAVGAAVPAAFVRPPGRPPADRRIGQVDEGRPATLARIWAAVKQYDVTDVTEKNRVDRRLALPYS